MSQIEVERFLGRLITDENFRGRAATSLAATCFQEGIAVSDTELSLLGRIDFSGFGRCGDLIDPSIKR
jgi:hypothetical protein